MTHLDLNRDIPLEEEIAHLDVLTLTFRGEHCIPFPMPRLKLLYVNCDRGSRLFIDAPHLTALIADNLDITNVSYLPSLKWFQPDGLHCIRSGLTAGDERKVSYLIRDIDHIDIDYVDELEEELVKIYIQHYHTLCDSSLYNLLPSYKTRAKSARSSLR